MCATTSVISERDVPLQRQNVRGQSSHGRYWTIFYLCQLPPFTHPCLLPSSDKQRNVSDCWENTRRSQRDIKDSCSGGESDREVFSSLPYRTMKTFYDELILSVTQTEDTRTECSSPTHPADGRLSCLLLCNIQWHFDNAGRGWSLSCQLLFPRSRNIS